VVLLVDCGESKSVEYAYANWTDLSVWGVIIVIFAVITTRKRHGGKSVSDKLPGTMQRGKPPEESWRMWLGITLGCWEHQNLLVPDAEGEVSVEKFN